MWLGDEGVAHQVCPYSILTMPKLDVMGTESIDAGWWLVVSVYIIRNTYVMSWIRVPSSCKLILFVTYIRWPLRFVPHICTEVAVASIFDSTCVTTHKLGPTVHVCINIYIRTLLIKSVAILIRCLCMLKVLFNLFCQWLPVIMNGGLFCMYTMCVEYKLFTVHLLKR